MLRSTLAQNAEPVYALSWSPDSQGVLYASGSILTIKALAPNSKPLQWKAHDALILCLDWSATNGKIVSGKKVVAMKNKCTHVFLKGQEISEGNCGVSNSSKKTMTFSLISAYHLKSG